jgi:DNA-binding response OmpR family regulator
MTRLVIRHEATGSDRQVTRIQIGELELSYQGSVAGRSIELSHLELELLAILAEERDQIISYDVITTRLWKAPSRGSVRHLSVIAHRLRRKLSDLLSPYEIVNVRARGYGLISSRRDEGPDEGSSD